MEIRRVVTAFIICEGEVLLLKRSGRVGTYRGRWAGVSGYLEGGEAPLERALREVGEELGLSEADIELERAAEPLGVPDPELSVLWVVYPHLIRSRRRDVKVDWEHTEYRWVKPEELYSYETVPGLGEAFEKTLPKLLEELTPDREALDDVLMIESDTTHGASWLARYAVEALKCASDRRISGTVEEHLVYLTRLAVRVMGLRSSMAPIGSAVGQLLHRVRERAEVAESVEALKSSVAEEAEEIVESSRRAVDKIAEGFLRLIPKKATVLTHSYSSTVTASLKYAFDHGVNLRVIATESRPLFEGRATAQELSRHGVPVTLISDSASGHFMKEADLVLVGADGVLADGSLVNKSGTYLIALAAKDLGVPFYAACEEVKFNLRSLFTETPLEERDQSELWGGSTTGISVRNLYFDLTPPNLITSIVTERRAYGPGEVAGVFEEELRRRYVI